MESDTRVIALLTEYTALRDQILQRHMIMYGTIGTFVGAISVLVAAVADNKIEGASMALVTIIAVLVATGSAIALGFIERDVYIVARHLEEIDAKIDELANEPNLMTWHRRIGWRGFLWPWPK